MWRSPQQQHKAPPLSPARPPQHHRRPVGACGLCVWPCMCPVRHPAASRCICPTHGRVVRAHRTRSLPMRSCTRVHVRTCTVRARTGLQASTGRTCTQPPVSSPGVEMGMGRAVCAWTGRWWVQATRAAISRAQRTSPAPTPCPCTHRPSPRRRTDEAVARVMSVLYSPASRTHPPIPVRTCTRVQRRGGLRLRCALTTRP